MRVASFDELQAIGKLRQEAFGVSADDVAAQVREMKLLVPNASRCGLIEDADFTENVSHYAARDRSGNLLGSVRVHEAPGYLPCHDRFGYYDTEYLSVEMSRLCVRPDMPNTQRATTLQYLLRMGVEKAREANARVIYAGAAANLLPYYKSLLSFKPVKGVASKVLWPLDIPAHLLCANLADEDVQKKLRQWIG